METETIDHDFLFKELFSQFFFGAVEFACPQAMPYLDTSYVEFLQQELFDEIFPAEKHIVDIAAKCRFAGSETYFLIHGENQAQPFLAMDERVFDYFALLKRKLKMPVFPIVIFSFDKPYRAEKNSHIVEFPWMKVLDFRFVVIQLNRLNWRDFLNKPNPVVCALMSKMKIAPKDRVKVKLECLRMLVTLKLDRKKTRFLAGFVDTYLKLNKTEDEQFQTDIIKTFPKEIVEETMELTNNWIDKGRIEGIQIGEKQLLLRQFTRKFGEVTPTIKDRLSTLNAAQIADFGEAFVDFNNLKDAEAWLNEHLPTT